MLRSFGIKEADCVLYALYNIVDDIEGCKYWRPVNSYMYNKDILPEEAGRLSKLHVIFVDDKEDLVKRGFVVFKEEFFSLVIYNAKLAQQYIDKKEIQRLELEMQYKTTTHIIMVDGSKNLRTFDTEDDMNEEIYAILDKDKNAKIKIFTVTGKIEPKRKDLSKLIKPV